MLFRAFIVSSLALAASAVVCPRCQPTDPAGAALSAQSGGTRGAPLFCAYGPNQAEKCFYDASTGGKVSSSDAGCPANAPLQDAC
ncbi:hypothetical protein C8J57DRAFT_1326397 [Mycena rebaudengoi]|nr:hypothetical protein C8J57DRAFT_1326397 [Mycena rebaudengoi]